MGELEQFRDPKVIMRIARDIARGVAEKWDGSLDLDFDTKNPMEAGVGQISFTLGRRSNMADVEKCIQPAIDGLVKSIKDHGYTTCGMLPFDLPGVLVYRVTVPDKVSVRVFQLHNIQIDDDQIGVDLLVK